MSDNVNNQLFNDQRYNSIELNKRLITPRFEDIMINTNGLSFNEGSVLYNRSDESLYVGNGETLGKIISENENGIATFDRLNVNAVVSKTSGYEPGDVVIYVDGTNGDDDNSGFDVNEPKLTLVSARNAIGDRAGSIIKIIAGGTYTIDGNEVDPTQDPYTRSVGNILYTTDPDIFDPYVVVSTHTVTSAVNGTVLRTGSVPSTVVINTPTAPAVAGGSLLRVVGTPETLYPIVSTVAGVSITVCNFSTTPFSGDVEIVNNTVTIDINNMFSSFNAATFIRVDIANTLGGFMLTDIGLTSFRYCTINSNGFNLRAGGGASIVNSVMTTTTPVLISNGASFANINSIYNGDITNSGKIISQAGIFNGNITSNIGIIESLGTIYNGNIDSFYGSTFRFNGAEINTTRFTLDECSFVSFDQIANINVNDRVEVFSGSTFCVHPPCTLTINSTTGGTYIFGASACAKVIFSSSNPVTLNAGGAVTSWIQLDRRSEMCNASSIVLGGGAPVATNSFYLRGGSVLTNNAAGEIVGSTNDINLTSGTVAYPGLNTTIIDANALAAGAGPSTYTGDFSKYIKTI